LNKVYIVYPGLGKTTLALKDARFADLEARIFKDEELKPYIGKIEYPNVRGIAVKEPNPEYPENYFSFVRKKMTEGKTILLVPKQDTYDLIDALGIDDYAWILPNADRVQQLRAEQMTRGDDAEYIENNLGVRYNDALELANKSGKKIIFLKPREYLSDAIKKLALVEF
jgi:hypothetical protein